MTSFDLYGTTAPTPPAPASTTTTTTLQALAAAEWTQLPDGRWQLQWRDDTDYGDDGGVDDNTGTFTCVLDVEGCDGWSYEYNHSHRGGEQNYELDCPSVYVSDAQEAARKEIQWMVDRWEQSRREIKYQRQSFDDDGEEDFSIDPEQEALERGELY